MSFFKVNHEEAKGGEFATIAEGKYEVIISKAEATESQSGNPMVKIQMTIRDDVGQEFQKRILFDNLVFMDKTYWKVQQFTKALDLPNGTSFADINEFVEMISYKAVKVKVKHEEYKGKTQERVDFYEVSDHGLGGSGAVTSTQGQNDPFANNGGSIDISDDDLPF